MHKFLSFLIASVLAVGLSIADAEAARLGGGKSTGMQRSSPAITREAPKPPQNQNAAPAAPTAPTQAAPVPPTPQPKPSFLGRWGGMLAGFGLGALLGSMLGGNLGAGLGALLNILVIGGLVFLLFRFLASRSRPAAQHMQYAAAGNRPPPEILSSGSASQPSQALPTSSAQEAVNVPPGFQVEPFIRQAKTAFLRLQAANDARDLDDIRDYTTPEMYAELAMQIRERGDAAQKTEVVSLDARLLEAVVEGNYAIASVHYSGLIREAVGANADSFDEVWHVRKNLNDPKATWLIAGIQQVA